MTATKGIESDRIDGVYVVDINGISEPRGMFAETFRVEWFPQRDWTRLQCNRSESIAGVLRGLHFHRRQADYWHCINGRIRVGLFDMRVGSPTRGRGDVLELAGDRPQGLLIPPGVAHGYLAVTDITLIYVVDQYYDGGADEFGVAWDDPALGLDWDCASPPLVSERDATNPRLEEITAESLPE
jgi:dTDP-4-dehydrorhamnose 3,5-epimerase